MINGFVCGVFDMYHAGHVMMLKECRGNCDYLIVAVNEAENINTKINPGKKLPLYSIEERVMIMESCKYVDKVLSYNSEDELLALMKKYSPDIRFLGDDYREKKITGSELNIRIHYTDRSHGLSTSKYKSQLTNEN
tara:strand:+ start:147 stop:554 length:408 start_codon:yes stop_codon:yes gene_type:complete